jgi:hypothetical protein
MNTDPRSFILYNASVKGNKKNFACNTTPNNTLKKKKSATGSSPKSESPSNSFVIKFDEEDTQKFLKTSKDSYSSPSSLLDNSNNTNNSNNIPNSSNPSIIDMNSYNIFHIDTIIKEKLTTDISNLPSLEKDLQLLLESLNESKNKLTKQQELVLLRKRIQDIQNTFALTLYIYRTADLLTKYSNLQQSESSRSFVIKDSSHRSAYAQETAEKNNIISQYISVAREYVEIENYRRVINVMMCPICKTTDMTKNVDEDTSFICKCGFETEILDDTPSFKDTDRVNMSSRYTYTRRGHFVDAIKKYQGKHNIDAETLQSVVATLHQEMGYHHLTSKTVTKDHLYMFLSEKRLCEHYEDINILYHIITGNICPEFSHLESALLELFEQQEKALVEVTATDKNDIRVNSINVYYKLYKLLQKLGYQCKKGDFYILKTKTKEDEHDEKMRRAWEILEWPWIETN